MSRRVARFRFVSFAVFFAVAICAAIAVEAADETGSASCHVYVGTYSQKAGEGLFHLVLDVEAGTLGEPQAVAEINSAYLVLHPGGKLLYATCLVTDVDNKAVGGVAAFAIDGSTGKLRELNRVPSGGTGPCHLDVDATGKCLVAANCGNARVSALAIDEDGSLRPSASIIQHTGVSVNSQQGPQAHSINVAPGGRFAFAADLGLDRIFAYRLDPQRATLTPHAPAFTRVAAGAGPRHFAFHPAGRFACAINELSNTLTTFAFDQEAGRLERLRDVSTLPAEFTGESYAAEVQFHPSGRFLYASNRGHDSIALFAVGDDGLLTPRGWQAAGGKAPRHFAVDPNGRFVLVANQKSSGLVLFRINQRTGELKPAGSQVPLDVPVCVKLLALP